MKNYLSVLILLGLAACSDGGGGGGGGSTGTAPSISYLNTTVSISHNSIKDGRQTEIIVTPKGTDGNAFSVSGKYDINIQFLPSSGSVRNLVHSDFTQVGSTWVATVTPDATSSALFYLVLNGAAHGNASLGDISTPKLQMDAWNECKEPSPDGPNATQIWRKRGAYNLICDYNDIDRLYYSGPADMAGTTINPVKAQNIYDRETISDQSASRQAAYMNSLTEDFVLMIDVNNFSSSIYNINQEAAYNRFFTELRTGRVYLNGKNGTNTLVFGKTVVAGGEANKFNTNNIITGAPSGF